MRQTADVTEQTGGCARPPERPRWRRVAPWVVAAALGAGALASILASSGGVADVGAAITRVSAGWTLAAAAAMLVGYLALAAHLRRLAAGRLTLWRAARADLLLFGLGNLLPGAPAPGALLAARDLRRAGMPPREVRLVLAFTAWFNIRTLLGLGALAFLVAVGRQHPGLRDVGLWWLAAIALLLLLAVSARAVARPHAAARVARLLGRVRIGRLAPPVARDPAAAGAWHAAARAIVGAPRNRAVLVLLALVSWLADASCLGAALVAAGVHLDADTLLLAYVVGILASGIPFLPAGLGAVEAMVPVVLHHFGAPLGSALAGTLVYRGISALLPAVAGALVLTATVIARRQRARSHRAQPSQVRGPQVGSERTG